MITSKNIGILLDFIKNSKKNSDLYLLVKKNSISLSKKFEQLEISLLKGLSSGGTHLRILVI